MSAQYHITKKMVDAAFAKWWNSDDDLALYDLWKSLERDYLAQQEQAKKAAGEQE